MVIHEKISDNKIIILKNIRNVVETMPIWHDMARKPKTNISAQYGVYVHGVAGLIEIHIDL